MNKKTLTSSFTLSGAIIGAGILGLPYVFSQSGFISGIFWLVFLGLIMLYVNLSLTEISLRTKDSHQLTGYAEKYLGKWAERIMLFAFCFGAYASLVAYLIGEGRSLSMIFFGSQKNAIFFGFLFWVIITSLLHEGLKGLKKVETYGLMAIIAIIGLIFIWLLPGINPSNISHVDYSNFFLPFGVVLFAYAGLTSIPELRREIKGNEKEMGKAVIIGSILPFFLYILFTFSIVGFLGISVKEVATLSFSGFFGRFVNILGIFTMFTSYFVLSFALKDMLTYDYKLNKKLIFTLVSILPLGIFFLINYFNLGGFISVLGIGGAVSNGIIGMLVMFILFNAKMNGERKPEFKIFFNWIVAIIIILIFIFGIVSELFF